MRPAVEVNGVRYRWPARPVAVVCVDGGDPAYLTQCLEEGAIPNIARFGRLAGLGALTADHGMNDKSNAAGKPDVIWLQDILDARFGKGDVVVISTADVCVGAAEADHDLSGLEGHRLRTHGGVSESKVPFILSEPLNDAYSQKAASAALKSYRIFDFALNGTAT